MGEFESSHVGVVFGLWHGGSSYSVGTVDEDVEQFPDLDTAKAEFMTRFASGRCNTFYYLSENADERQGLDTPAVDAACEMLLWYADPRGVQDPYPDALMRLGLDCEHALVEQC